MKKLFMTLAVAGMVALATSCGKDKGGDSAKSEEPLMVVVNDSTQMAEDPNDMLADYVKLTNGKYEVGFDKDNATVEIDAEVLKQALFTIDPDMEIVLLDEGGAPVGDFAVMGVDDTKAFDTAIKGKPGKGKVKFSSKGADVTLSEDQIKTLKEKAKTVGLAKSQGVQDLYFVGEIDGKYPIHMALSGDLTEGSYYYDKSGVNNPMYLELDAFDPATSTLDMTERNADGVICGKWGVTLSEEGMKGDCLITFSGKMYNIDIPRYTEEVKPGEFSPARTEE